MALRFESEFIFIGRGDESFLENYSYERADEKPGESGKIFMSLEILNNHGDAEDIGEMLFANFKQKFYAEISGDPYCRFEAALKEINGAIESLKEEKVSRFIGNLNVAVGAIVGDSLLLTVTGDAEVYLVRNRFVSIVSEGLAQESKGETFVNIASGTLEEEDRIIFSSTRLLRYITKQELGKIFSGADSTAEQSLMELQDAIMTEILGRSAVTAVLVKHSPDFDRELEEVTESPKMGAQLLKRWMPGSQAFLAKFLRKMPAVSELRRGAGRFFSSIGSFYSKARGLIGRPLPTPHHDMSREKILVSVIALLALLIGAVFWMRGRGAERRLIEEYQAKLDQVEQLVNEASTQGQFDKAKAAKLLDSAEKEALEVLNSRFLRADAVKKLDAIQANRDALDDVKRVVAPTILADLSQKRPNVSALGLLRLKDKIFSFDYNALFEIVLDAVQDPLPVSDTETIILGTDFPETNAILFLTRTGKLIEYKDSRFASVSTKDGLWKKGVDMKTYNDRLYILDAERNQIWRYIRRRDGFDSAEGINQNADLKGGRALTIDSSIYVLNFDGSVTQLYQGQKQDYPLRKKPLSAMTEPKRIFTTPESNYLYFLEPSKQRVVVFRKDPQNGGAHYLTQYVFSNTGVLRDLLVEDNRLYVMDEKRVYSVNLSGL